MESESCLRTTSLILGPSFWECSNPRALPYTLLLKVLQEFFHVEGLDAKFQEFMGCEIELEAMATIKALGIKGGTQGQGQNALIALRPHHDNQGALIWIDIHGSPSLYCSCEWDLSHDNANS